MSRIFVAILILAATAKSAFAFPVIQYQNKWPVGISGISNPLEPTANDCSNIDNGTFVLEQVFYLGPGPSDWVSGFVGRSKSITPSGHHLRRVFTIDFKNLYKSIPDAAKDDVLDVIHVGASLNVEYQSCGSGGYTSALAVRNAR